MVKPRVVAFYLPQFHPIPENDEWWGKGFTEWTNVGKAKKLFPGHCQPRIPADLGYYDLRVPETREEQAKFARDAGVEGFCYWHYWFGNGKELLDRPFKEVLSSGKPNFPFCLAWANHSWYAKTWDKDVRKDRLLIEQTYGDVEDYKKHFYALLPAFKDERYMKQDDKPIFMIYSPLANDDVRHFMDVWDELAKKEGLKGIYWVGHCLNDCDNLDKYKALGFDSINVYSMVSYRKRIPFFKKAFQKIFRLCFKMPDIADFEEVVSGLSSGTENDPAVCPTILAGWDNTPRNGRNGCVLTGYTPASFKRHVERVVSLMNARPKNNGLVFLKSWNEWAEGNYIEPDMKWGTGFLDALAQALSVK